MAFIMCVHYPEANGEFTINDLPDDNKTENPELRNSVELFYLIDSASKKNMLVLMRKNSEETVKLIQLN